MYGRRVALKSIYHIYHLVYVRKGVHHGKTGYTHTNSILIIYKTLCFFFVFFKINKYKIRNKEITIELMAKSTSTTHISMPIQYTCYIGRECVLLVKIAIITHINSMKKVKSYKCRMGPV